MFQARNPILSDENVCVNLHIDLESQKTYRPGYPVEKRGMYYLARSLSSQLSVITGQTDYRQLEKCYNRNLSEFRKIEGGCCFLDSGEIFHIPRECNNICKSTLDVILEKS